MAAKTQATVSGTATPTPDGSGPELETVKAGTFDWGTLAAPVAMPTKAGPSGIKVDVLATVAEAIRQRAEQSLTINVERVKATKGSAAKRARVDYHWELQAVASKPMGDEFVKLLTKYAKYRPSDKDIPHAGPNSPRGQVTARTGETRHYRKTDDGTYIDTNATTEGAFMGVRYSVRPFEQRGTTARLPGTTA